MIFFQINKLINFESSDEEELNLQTMSDDNDPGQPDEIVKKSLSRKHNAIESDDDHFDIDLSGDAWSEDDNADDSFSPTTLKKDTIQDKTIV